MVNQTKEKSIDQFVYRARAVLEHMFYDHTYCDISWCNALKAAVEENPYNHPDKFFTCATDDGEKLY